MDMPTEGGRYTRDPKTGNLTRQKASTDPAPVDQAQKKPTPTPVLKDTASGEPDQAKTEDTAQDAGKKEN